MIAALSACAPEPVVHGSPADPKPRLELASLAPLAAPIDALTVPSLFPQRIVPSGAPWISARWSQLPAQNPLNDQVQAWVHAETAGFVERTGGPAYAPRASPAGSGGASRGCALGSTQRAAAELLTDASLAPIVPPGTPTLALNCDIVFASGGLLGVRTRTTSVDALGAVSDVTTLGYSMDGAEMEPAAGFIAPGKLGEFGQLLLASLGYRDLPSMFAPAAIARPITEEETAELGAARLVVDSVPQADGALLVAVALDDLPGGGPSLVQRVEWMRAGALAGGQVGLRVAHPEPWLSERGTAARAIALAKAGPTWQPVPAARQAIDCGLVPCIALTFDDGPGGDSERLLNVLAETNSGATFFLLGSSVSRAPGIAAAEAASGHTIANHSWSHPDLTTLPPEKVAEQVASAQRAIEAATGITPRYFRPPYGALNARVLAEIPLPTVLWSIDTNDWQQPGEDALVERVSVAQPGEIILFHDVHTSTVDAMPRVIGELQDRGLELVTLDDLLGAQPVGVRISRG